MTKQLVYPLVVFWVIASVVALYFAQSGTLKEFDPRFTLLSWTDEESFDSQLASALISDEESAGQWQLFHITQANCFCNLVSAPHRSSVNTLANELDVTNVEIDLNDSPDLRQLIPSTPAVVLINDKKELVYAGPYASGVQCAPGEGLIEPWLNKESADWKQGAAIVTDAQGCYCENRQSKLASA